MAFLLNSNDFKGDDLGLENFFDANYQVACTMQRGINKDNKMKEMLSFSEKDSALVHSWMKDYGLF